MDKGKEGVRPPHQREQRWIEADRLGEMNAADQGDSNPPADSLVQPTSGSANICA